MQHEPIVAPSRRSSSARIWFLIAAVASIVTLAAVAQGWSYQKGLRDAEIRAQAYRFKNVEVALNQPPFNGISTQINVDRWLPEGPRDIVRDPESIALNETITLGLQPLITGTGCSPSNVDSYNVLVDAPGFAVDKIGDAIRSREMLLAPICSLSTNPPPPAPAWRWNLMATVPGNHVITLMLQALDKNESVVDSREVDIPVIVPDPPQPLSVNIGIVGGVVTIATGLIGLWERFRKRPPAETPTLE
jgi:hypothetical protein